jgi:hypothetical protein
VSVLAIQQPPSGNLPLFLHVLGATVLFGGMLALTIVSFAARRGAGGEHAPLLSRLFLRAFLLAVVPAYVVMRVGAQWIDSKEYPHGKEPGWVGVGFAVSDVGILVLLVIGIVAFLARRRPGQGWPTKTLPVLSSLYVLALAVAWFAMSGKPGS